jgi:hypothetical protein
MTMAFSEAPPEKACKPSIILEKLGLAASGVGGDAGWTVVHDPVPNLLTVGERRGRTASQQNDPRLEESPSSAVVT